MVCYRWCVGVERGGMQTMHAYNRSMLHLDNPPLHRKVNYRCPFPSPDYAQPFSFEYPRTQFLERLDTILILYIMFQPWLRNVVVWRTTFESENIRPPLRNAGRAPLPPYIRPLLITRPYFSLFRNSVTGEVSDYCASPL